MRVASRLTARLGIVLLSATLTGMASAADLPKTVTVDWAYYNPVSLVLKKEGWLESNLGKDGVSVRWVLSLGSNKAIEFLNADSVNFGSTAGSAALLARINGSPIRAVYIYSKPEWTALVTRPDTGITKVVDLKGKRVAVTRGTDPYIFLLRALQRFGLSERDIKPVLLQHPDGRTALEQGAVDAWAGLDPMMAQTELENGSKLFFRDANLNTYGFLNVREEFAKQYPAAVERVLAVYEQGRKWALAHPAELRQVIAEAANLTDAVAARQLERTDLSNSRIGAVHRDTIVAAGHALQQSGVIEANVDVDKAANELIDTSFGEHLAAVR